MAFEWDPDKNAVNIAKHGIDFEDAVRIFEGPVLESSDERRSSKTITARVFCPRRIFMGLFCAELFTAGPHSNAIDWLEPVQELSPTGSSVGCSELVN